jgi:hypothetical protein
MVHMHPDKSGTKNAYARGTIRRVPNQPKTPNRVIRVDDDLWRDYGAACEAEGVTRSDDMRAHMLRKVRAWKRRAAATAGDGAGSQTGEPSGTS